MTLYHPELEMDSPHSPFILFSLGGSCVLLFGAPDSPMARPRRLVGGHLIGAATGLVFGHLLGDGVVVMSSAVGH